MDERKKKRYHKFSWSVVVKTWDLISLCNRIVVKAPTTKISDMEKTIKTVKKTTTKFYFAIYELHLPSAMLHRDDEV